MWLRIESGDRRGETMEIRGRQLLVGRDDDCDLTLEDERASRRHARFELLESGGVVVRDLGSTNGTFVDDRRIDEPVVLEGGERIRIGHTTFAVSGSEQAPATTFDAPARPAPAAAPVATPAAARGGETESVLERRELRQSARRSTVIAGVAVLLVIVLAVIVVAGVLSGGDGDDDAAAIVDDVRSSTVLIQSLRDDKIAGTGSGWVLDADEGLIVTNHHVVNSGTTYAVGVDGDERDARVVGTAPCEDLALLKVDNTDGLEDLALGSQERLRQGRSVVALGFPLNASLADELQATSGVVSVVQTRLDLGEPALPVLTNVVQTDAAINGGNSGGPLVDTDRRLVGVNVASDSGAESQGYAIGVDRVMEVLATLREGNSIGWTGMNFEFITGADLEDENVQILLDDLGLPVRQGLLVFEAVPRTPARQADFGDIPVLVTAVNGTPMDGTLRTYCRAVRGFESSDTAEFSVIVPGDPRAFAVELPFA